MIATATILIAAGVIACTLGAKLFKLLLPLIGFITGFMVGFLGFQGVFGAGAVSSVMAVLIALVFGLLLAILSYAFFDIAVKVFAVAVGASAFSYLGVALGLSADGFVVFLMTIAGGILAGIYAFKNNISPGMIIAVTSLLGVAYILVGLMLAVGNVTLDDIAQTGVVPTLVRVVDQSFLWFFVWVGGSLISMQLQRRLLIANLVSRAFEYDERELAGKK